MNPLFNRRDGSVRHELATRFDCFPRRAASLLALAACVCVASQVAAGLYWESGSTYSASSFRSGQDGSPSSARATASPSGTDSASATSDTPAAEGTSFVELTTSMGVIVIELDAANAPATCANFIEYVKNGFYDGTCFNRVVPGFVVQAGGYGVDLLRKPVGEPIKSEWKPSVKNKRGTVAMNRFSNRPDSATTQFFINVADNAGFDSARDGAGYTVFGRILDGMAVLENISKVRTVAIKGMRDVPAQPVLIERAEWSATRPEYRAQPGDETDAVTVASGEFAGGGFGSSVDLDASATAPEAVSATVLRLDPTQWRPWGLVLSRADETPRNADAVSATIRVAAEAMPGPDGQIRCLVGPDEIDLPAGQYAFSVIARAGDLGLLQLALNDNERAFVNFDLKAGAVMRRGDGAVSAIVEPLGDGWYRLGAVFVIGRRQFAPSHRRLLLIDDGEVGWHPENTKVVGHIFLASPKPVAGLAK